MRNTPHIYLLLARHSELRGVMSSAQMRRILDRPAEDGEEAQPYSALAFGVVAALQILHAARREGPTRHGGFPPLDLLMSTGCWGPPKGRTPRGAFIYRGLWVPEVIDEERARYQWSVNSFSRSMDGVVYVLGFYAGASGSEAAQIAMRHKHVLVLIARRGRSPKGDDEHGRQWSFPVQFFNVHGTWDGRFEQELLLPPFVEYVFEEDLELRTEMPADVRGERVAELERRWGVDAGLLWAQAPLLGWFFGAEIKFGHVALKAMKVGEVPRITVRFVREVRLPEPVRALFDGDQGSTLLRFPFF